MEKGWVEDQELPFSDSDTSREAAEKAATRAPRDRDRIAAKIIADGPISCFELHGMMPHQTASARLRELVLKGKIKQVGIAKSDTGNRERIYDVVKS